MGEVSVLEQMAAGIMAHKQAANAKLTPIGCETQPLTTARSAGAPLAGPHKVAFPYDDPQTVINALDVAEEEVGHILKSIAVLRQLYGGLMGQPDIAPVDTQKLRERAADLAAAARDAASSTAAARDAASSAAAARDAASSAAAGDAQVGDAQVTEASLEDFSSKLQQLAEDAQTSVFSPAIQQHSAATGDGAWVCPTHRLPASRPAVSRKGRHYLACPECDLFER